MTNSEYIRKLDNFDFSNFLDKISDEGPWIKWLNENYCKNCPPIIGKYNNYDMEFAACEMGVPCKFHEMSNQKLIECWLEQEYEEYEESEEKV